ncbi:FAM172 family protein homolog CG10038 [Microplitis demolitor]|uniref:FAM172 family protein homolog CG10038 n=1 Tax=Microplitis demolitor TaxID=69319 RepID=UPI0004CD85AF|nr:FAM172 family protein homolog CG10038 [Microplitis demolitor]XP_008552886.1 FAM172 family protein homolog CG10038 [Microplitis demolitor]XP_014300443.1 FAM172 family protein homolog CG10038 [Microplitis demolitor]
MASASARFPNNLKDFGYDFDEGGRLRKLDPKTGLITNEGFEFNVSEDAQYNQKRYEALGEVINQYVYELLEKEGLKRLPLPKNSDSPLELRSFVFACDKAFTNKKLMILIHGSGVVRAGQWARRLIINDNLKSGTQLPYIKKAKELGYGIIVLNTNDNRRLINGVNVDIKGSEDPHEHMETVWSDYIKSSEAKDIAIVAHSYGGVCTVEFAHRHPEEFKKLVFAVGFTDSVHRLPRNGCEHVVQVSKNWVSSEQPLDTPVDCASDDVPCVSAGHPVHEMTSWSCIESLFKFLEERYHNRIKGKD